jgi:hypothetical protein
MWVGNPDQSDSDNEDSVSKRTPDAVWTQSGSLPADQDIDFDLLVTKINELNIVSGEGVFKIQHTADGARLKVCTTDDSLLKRFCVIGKFLVLGSSSNRIKLCFQYTHSMSRPLLPHLRICVQVIR